MRIQSAAFLLGVCLVQTAAVLDGRLAAGGLLIGAAAALGAVLALRRGRGRPPHRLAAAAAGVVFALGAGLAWAAWRAEARIADELDGRLEGVELQVRGRVASLPQQGERGWRFVFEIEPGTSGVPQRVQLSWRADGAGPQAALPALRAGERWAFTVRLWRPHGFANPSGFDYEAWLLERGVRATGSVRAARLLDERPAAAMQHVHRLRGELRARLLAALPEGEQRGLLVALAVGDQQDIEPAQWDVFRRTGVAHLVSISGLHVALVATFCGGLAGLAWRRLPALVLRVPVQKAVVLCGLAGASGYAVLAGMGIPVLRAWLMLLVAASALLSGRGVAPSRVLAAALVVVLVADPWAVLAVGFWLSFGAVAVILAVVGGRVTVQAGWRGALRIQLAISFALVPLLLAQFQSLPLLSPLANLIAIPVVSFVVTPLVLVALPWPAPPLLWPANLAAEAMMAVLSWLAALEFAVLERALPPPWLLACALVAVALLLLPRATPGRLAAPVLLAGLLAWQPERPPPGGFRAWVLDVGQGLAVHVQTHAHDLLYDAGPPYGDAADAGGRVILPWLRAAGVRTLDRLVLSHPDADHVGGAATVLGTLAVERVLAGGAESAAGRARWPGRLLAGAGVQDCAGVPPWSRDGVRFEILHPQPAAAASAPRADAGARRGNDNDASCVLRVSTAAGALLLTGDIGAAVEAALAARVGEGLRSVVVVSPHHGSRSSSSAAFVAATLPGHVVHSAGHRNAFGHPHGEVWARWAAAGARNWRTDAQGAIVLEFPPPPGDGVAVGAQRERSPRYWHGR